MGAARKVHRLGARTLTGRNWRTGEAQGLHHGIVQRGADLGDLLVFAGGIDAVGQQDDEELAVRVDPDRCAGKAGVAEAVRGEVMAAGGTFCRDGPAESARSIRERLWRGELSYGGSFQNTAVSVDTPVQQHLAEGREVGRCTEYARMARDAAHGECVLVVDFALYQPIAQVAVEFSWRDPSPEVLCRPERRVFHAERRKNVRFR